MSTFSHILPIVEPGSSRTGGERPNASPAAGVAGLFAELMAQAQALSPDMPASKEVIPTRDQTNAETDDKGQQLSPEQLPKIANLQPGKMQVQVAPLAKMVGNSIVATVAPPKPEVTSTAIQSNPGTTVKSGEKTDATAKMEKNTQPQAAQPGAAPVLNETLINQIIAGSMSSVSPISSPLVKLESKSPPSVPERTTPVNEVPASPAAAAQTMKSSGTFISASGSNLTGKETNAASQSPAVSAADPLTMEGEPIARLAKNEVNAISFDAVAKISEAKSMVTSAEHPSADEPFSDRQSATQSSPDGNGISAAKQDVSVKQTDKTNNIAGQTGQTEKVLPGNTAVAAQAIARPAVSFHPEQVTETDAVNSDALENSAAAAASAVHLASPASSIPAVERMQEMVTLNAVRLSDSGNNSMQVVIKPDSGTQLSLELRQHGGSVQVQAVLQQGDFHQLNQQWPELQQRLGQRGIQLAPLGDDATAGNGSAAGSFQQHQQQQTAEPVTDDYFADTPARQVLPAIAHAPVIAQTPARRGWETWA